MSRGGRGRGRGRGNVSFNMEAIGFGRGDALPAPILQPPPKFPPSRQPPLPLVGGDEAKYLLALKKEFLQTMQASPYFIKAEQEKTDVDRYSDKYRASRNTDNTIEWEPDWRRFPKELKIAVRKKRKASARSMVSNLPAAKSTKNKDETDISKKLEVLEKKDTENADRASNKDEDESENDELEEDVVAREEDEEEGNDYISSYFDNGESYLDEEEDTLDDKEGGIY
ncbi:DNA-directed RNA polymerase III subunit RPC7-like [Clavelina lepadiformis]|uniref:DNA-directed RNA polymerase III subunit RPC7-like n=1 Tax=Clavelina lepadiformis TaxID=159417 RepID=UPI00404372CE